MAKGSGVELEVSNLVIPTLNDKPEEIRQLVRWVKANLGGETPLHFLGFFPRYKMRTFAANFGGDTGDGSQRCDDGRDGICIYRKCPVQGWSEHILSGLQKATYRTCRLYYYAEPS